MSSHPIMWAMMVPGAILIGLRLGTLHRSSPAILGNFDRWIRGTLLAQLVLATTVFALHAIDLLRGTANTNSLIEELVLADGTSLLMYLMASFVGWVVVKYSVRHLDGDPKSSDFSCWTGLTVAAVSLMVIANNMILFMAMWILISVGLDRLLSHRSERPRARSAASLAFVVARISDAALAIAFILLYRESGTLNFAELIQLANNDLAVSANLNVACLALVIAAAAKSTLIPFHFWLPQTLESPTPVSALMHAGIVNAGGFLIIRFSPVMMITPWCLTLLAVLGLATTCLAGLVMLTQTSIKSKLAYSTIAQMGFMMFQCGLGAFSAALLHIIAHSIYKAYCFLDSGSIAVDSHRVSTQTAAVDSLAVSPNSKIKSAALGMTAFVGTMSLVFGSLMLFGINPQSKPGGLILGTILAIAIARWLTEATSQQSGAFKSTAILVASAICLTYAGLYAAVSGYTGSALPSSSAAPSQLALFAILAMLAMGTLLWVELSIRESKVNPIMHRLYIHASHSFYLDSSLRLLFTRLRNS